jgi:hypothetical protein
VQKVSKKLIARIGKEKFFPLCPTEKEAAHSLQKNQFIFITFE